MDYGLSSDEQLVHAYQTVGDDRAVTELANRYQTFMRRKAQQVSSKSPFIGVDDFYSAFLDKLWKAVRNFDATRQSASGVPVTFGAYLRLKLATAAYDLIRRDPQTMAVTKGVYFVDVENPSEDDSETELVDEHASVERHISESATELYQYIMSQSVVDAQVLKLKAEGYGGEEIARRVGRTGNPAALRNWTKRAVERLQRYTVSFYQSCDATHEIETYVS